VSAAQPLKGLSVDAARRALATQLKDSNIESPDLDARLLIGAALHLDHTGLAAQAARQITDDEAEAIAHLAQRRIAREPVARILGRKEFWGLDLRVSEATLVPRPDTETIVEAALDILRSNARADGAIRVADIGTGSGALLLALLSECRNATGVGTDISPAALEIAALNARDLDLAHRATFVRCDYATALTGPFDVIVSNPPYIRSADVRTLEQDVRDHDPHLALDGGADGLEAYRAILAQVVTLLAPGGVLIFEVGHDQSTQVSEMMRAAGLTLPGPPRADLSGVERAVIGLKAAL
jgi:release factor glutamine methyltransferase